MAQFFLEADRVTAFVQHLMNGHRVIAPHRKGRSSFAFAEAVRAEAVVLNYPRAMQSVRKFFLPPREDLLEFDLQRNTCTPGEAEPMEAVFLGVHSYDLAAVHRLDHNFSTGQPERNYLRRREGALWVGVSYEPDEFHFAGSVGIGAQETAGFDLFLTRLLDGFVIDVLTEAGRRLLEGFEAPLHETALPAPKPFKQHIYVPQDRLNAVMAASYHNPVWEETAAGCVGCGTCNLVCPTCYCFNVEEEVDLKVTGGVRSRHWDGCMLRGFTEVAGGEVFREPLSSRQRHRIMRKFKYLSEDTGQPWCVGCGRCIAACTAGISIVNIVNRCIADYEKSPVSQI